MALTVSEITSWIGGRVVNGSVLRDGWDQRTVKKPAGLSGSKSDDLAYFFNKAYQTELGGAQPGVLVTGEAFVKPLEAAGLPLWKQTVVIACPDPYLAMAVLSEKFAAVLSTAAHEPTRKISEKNQIHPTAVIHPTAELGKGVQIGAHCVVEEKSRVGSGSVLYPGCFLGPGTVLGEHCVLFPGVTVYEWSQMGSRVRIHAGTVIGSDGFGYAPVLDKSGAVIGHKKIYHLGRVIIGNDVEIGANSCVDRGTVGDTRIGDEAKIDNLVQIGHNAVVARGAVICGGTCLAGSSSVGEFAYIGGLTGITNQVHVGAGAKVGAVSLVTKDVPPGGTAVGNPQRDHKEHFKVHALLNRLLRDRKAKGESL